MITEQTPRSILEEEFPQRIRERAGIAKKINAIVHFDIQGPSGGVWTIDCTKTSDWIRSGQHGLPKIVVSVSDDDFVKIHLKQLNPQVAGLTGRVKFKPVSLSLMADLGKLLF